MNYGIWHRWPPPTNYGIFYNFFIFLNEGFPYWCWNITIGLELKKFVLSLWLPFPLWVILRKNIFNLWDYLWLKSSLQPSSPVGCDGKSQARRKHLPTFSSHLLLSHIFPLRRLLLLLKRVDTHLTYRKSYRNSSLIKI